MKNFANDRKKPLNILFINCDRRNLFEDRFDEFYKKLERDRLNPDFNIFFFFSWAEKSYYRRIKERFFSVHVKTRWHFFRPILDLMSIFLVPYKIFKYGFKPNVILVYDFGFLPTAKIIKIIFGGKIVFGLTNMPHIYSKTRSFGIVKSFYSFTTERLFRGFMDQVYTINDTTRKYAESLGIKKEKITIFASDTINRDRHYIDSSRKGIIKSKYGLEVDEKIIMSVGRLEAEKDFSRLLKIFSKLDKKYVLMVLGQGSLKESLEKIATDLGVKKRVIFPGFVERSEIWNYYQDADLFMLLSKAEALGLVFWEAMYMSVPVIGSTAPGIIETIGGDGERGFILENDEDIDLINKKIDFCIGSSDDKKRMLERAKEYVSLQIKNDIDINKIII